MSINIVNAFNSISWDWIRRILFKHRVPIYSRNTIGSYFSDRAITYRIEGGMELRSTGECRDDLCLVHCCEIWDSTLSWKQQFQWDCKSYATRTIR